MHPLVVFWNWICIVVLSYFGLIWFAGSYYYRIIIALQLKILVNEQYLCRRLSFFGRILLCDLRTVLWLFCVILVLFKCLFMNYSINYFSTVGIFEI